MDLVEIAKLSENGIIVLNPDRQLPEEPTLSEGANNVWEHAQSAIMDDPIGYALQASRTMTEDYKD